MGKSTPYFDGIFSRCSVVHIVIRYTTRSGAGSQQSAYGQKYPSMTGVAPGASLTTTIATTAPTEAIAAPTEITTASTEEAVMA